MPKPIAPKHAARVPRAPVRAALHLTARAPANQVSASPVLTSPDSKNQVRPSPASKNQVSKDLGHRNLALKSPDSVAQIRKIKSGQAPLRKTRFRKIWATETSL